MTREIRVGLTVLVALVCMGLLVVFLGRIHFSQPGYKIHVDYNFVDSLRLDAPVLYGGGVEIGMVDAIEVADGKVRTTLHIYNDYQIPKDSKFTIHTSGILGEKYVQVAAGDLSTGHLEAGTKVVGMDPGSLDRTLQKVEALTAFLEPMLTDPDFKKSFSKIVSNVDKMTDELSTLVAQSGPDIRASVKNLKEVSTDLKGAISDAKVLLSNANQMASKKNRQNLEQGLDSLLAATTKLDKAVSAIHSQDGALGLLIHDEEAKDNLRYILRDLKRHPWKLLWKK